MSFKQKLLLLALNFYYNLIFFFKRNYKKDSILLIPPTDLNGSFGDELMVVSFLENYKNHDVIIRTRNLYSREDLLKQYTSVRVEILKLFPFDIYKFKEIHVLGADNMDGGYGIFNPIFKLTLLKIANKFKITTSIKGFSLNKKVPLELKKAYLKASSKTVFYLRDIDSFERAQSFLPISSTKQVADLGFLTPKYDVNDDTFNTWYKKISSNNLKIVAFCPNAIQCRKVGHEKYMSLISKALIHLIEKHNYAVLFLYHDLRKHSVNDSDLTLSKKLFENINNPNSYFVNDIKNGLVLKHYLEFSNFTFTGRMHFGISGLSLKKPMFGISYQDKFSGLLKLFGVDPYVCLKNYDSLEEICDTLDVFIENFEIIQGNINSNFNSVKSLSSQNF